MNGHLEHDGPIESLSHILMKHMRLTKKRPPVTLWSIDLILRAMVVGSNVVTQLTEVQLFENSTAELETEITVRY
jgi:hypothetical protein